MFVTDATGVAVGTVAPVAVSHVQASGGLLTVQDAAAQSVFTTGTALPLYTDHRVVNHSQKEYMRVEKDGSWTHTNTVESFFSLLKRGVYGSWHHLSREHLQRYCDEVGFRWNHRKVSDGARLVEAVKATEGKRLTYTPLVRS